MAAIVALIAGLVAVLSPAVAGAAPRVAPAPCGGVPQITDASGDGHHASSDVLRAWMSETSGHVQAVIEVRVGAWAPEHDDADVNGSGFALLFTAGGQIHYVRATAPPPLQGPITYDYGTYTAGGGFVSSGATAGEVLHASPGTVTIDVPAVSGAVAGARLTGLFVLTYDGITGGVPTWVDHAPGGVLPTDPSVGADYLVGGCDPGHAADDHDGRRPQGSGPHHRRRQRASHGHRRSGPRRRRGGTHLTGAAQHHAHRRHRQGRHLRHHGADQRDHPASRRRTRGSVRRPSP